MLVLSRTPGESIVFDLSNFQVDPSNPNKQIVFLEVEEIKGKYVKLGFTADRSIRILRNEIYVKQAPS